MAYTKYGGGDEELDKILSDYGSKYQAARESGDVKGMREANDSANQARNAKGYAAELANEDIEYVKRATGYGSSKGSGGSSGGGFSYESAPAYTSKYQSQIDELTKEILGRAAFEYDPESDPTYQQYRKTYTREGQRAMQDTLGEVSARTGGVASSYAASAANQANDYYMGQLADKVPELRQLAYQMYQDEENKMRSNLDMLLGLDGADYGKYADLLGQFNTDRNFAYGAGRDQVADERYEREYADSREDVAYDRDYTAKKDQYEKDYNAAVTLYQQSGDASRLAALWGYTPEEAEGMIKTWAEDRNITLEQAAFDMAERWAKHGDFSKLKEQGVDTSYAETMQKGELWELAQQMTGGGGSKGGSSGGGGRVSGGKMDYESLFSAAQASGNPKSWLAQKENYQKYGFSSSSGLWDDYQTWNSRITDFSQLGSAAKQIANGMSRVNSTSNPGYREGLSNTIEKALDNGSITEAEAEYLLDMMGF